MLTEWLTKLNYEVTKALLEVIIKIYTTHIRTHIEIIMYKLFLKYFVIIICFNFISLSMEEREMSYNGFIACKRFSK